MLSTKERHAIRSLAGALACLREEIGDRVDESRHERDGVALARVVLAVVETESAIQRALDLESATESTTGVREP